MTTVELLTTPKRLPSELSYGELTGGVEPVAVFQYAGVWLLHFEADLTPNQITNVRARAEGTAQTDELRADVLDAAPNIELILNSGTGALTNQQLSDASRALAQAVYALGKLVLNQTGT